MMMKMPTRTMVCTLALGLLAAGCAKRQPPGDGGPGEGQRTCTPGQPRTVTIPFVLEKETVAANDQIKDAEENRPPRVCKGDTVVWKFTNNSGLAVDVKIGQFRENGNPANKPDPVDFGFPKDNSESIGIGETGVIDGKVKKKDLPRLIKYDIFLETDHLKTIHDPRLDIIDGRF